MTTKTKTATAETKTKATTKTAASSDLNPQPRAWPRCSTCKTAYVLRRAMVMSAPDESKPRRMTLGSEWVWQRDCKHRQAAPEVAGVLRSVPRRRRSSTRRGEGRPPGYTPPTLSSARRRPMTRVAFLALPPRKRGYATYMLGARADEPNVTDEKNPYSAGSADAAAWDEGARHASIDAQDGEED